MKFAPALLIALASAACATVPADTDGVARAGIGQRVYVDGPYVTPLAVLEDSRCPVDLQCVWAGRTRFSVKIDLGARSETREISSGEPIHVADGDLALVEVAARTRGRAERSNQGLPLRFHFRRRDLAPLTSPGCHRPIAAAPGAARSAERIARLAVFPDLSRHGGRRRASGRSGGDRPRAAAP